LSRLKTPYVEDPPVAYPEKVQKAIAECTDRDDPQLTHEPVHIPISELRELPLGSPEGGQSRRTTFELARTNMSRIRKARIQVNGFQAARRKPGTATVARTACYVESLGGAALDGKIAEQTAELARLYVGDLWTLVFMLQTARARGRMKLPHQYDCPTCGITYQPVLELGTRKVACYRVGAVVDEKGNVTNQGQPLPAGETPHAVYKLAEPAKFAIRNGEESTHLVMTPPAWISSLHDAPQADWDMATNQEDPSALFERVLVASIIGDQAGPFPGPVTLEQLYKADLHGIDGDGASATAIILIGGPPNAVEVECPGRKSRNCEAVTLFPVGWDNPDFFGA
jgi:hypothetical protein